MIDGKITDFSSKSKQKEFKKLPQLLNKWTINRRDNAFTKNIKIGTLGRISNILDYNLNFGSYTYTFDIEEIQPWPFAEIRNAVKKERLKNVELESSSTKVTKINFKN